MALRYKTAALHSAFYVNHLGSGHDEYSLGDLPHSLVGFDSH